MAKIRTLSMLLLVSLVFLIHSTDVSSLDSSGLVGVSEETAQKAFGHEGVREPLHIIFNFSAPLCDPSGRQLLKSIIAAEKPTEILEIRVVGSPQEETLRSDWKLLIRAFDKVTGLQWVEWAAGAAIPKKILRSLEERNPECRLYFTTSLEHSRRGRISNWGTSLIGSRLLYSLKAEIVYAGDPNFHDLDIVFNILGSCPNLKELNLSISRWGCVLSSGQPYAFDFLSRLIIKFPTLEKLTVSGYRFDQKPDMGYGWQSMPSFGRGDPFWYWIELPAILLGYVKRCRFGMSLGGMKREIWPLNDDAAGRTSLDWWIEVMDWSHLHTLDLTSSSEETLAKLNRILLPALKDLTLRDSKANKQALDFISDSAEQFERLSLQNMAFESLLPVVDIVSEHQKGLQSLAIHQSEANYGFDHHLSALNAAHISRLLNSCLSLRRLDIDAVRSPDWNTDVIRTLSSPTSNLSHLRLHFPSADAFMGKMDYWNTIGNMSWEDWNNLPDPLINQTSVENLFRTLREDKTGQELYNLDVYVGNWEDRNLPSTMAPRDRRRVAWYSCNMRLGEEVCIGQQTRISP